MNNPTPSMFCSTRRSGLWLFALAAAALVPAPSRAQTEPISFRRHVVAEGQLFSAVHSVSVGPNGEIGILARYENWRSFGSLPGEVPNPGAPTTLWYHSAGGPEFEFALAPVFDMPNCDAVLAGDLDGDGFDDVVTISNQPHNALLWFRNNGASPPAFEYNFLESRALEYLAPAIGDFDNDGDNDILVEQKRFDDPSVHGRFLYANDGAGGFARHRFPEFGLPPLPGHAADFDGDGDIDIASDALYLNEDPSRSVFRVRPFAAAGLANPLSGAPYRVVATGDLNGDGFPDFILPGSVWVENPGPDNLACACFPTRLLNAQGALGDANGDGHLDFLSETAAYLNDGLNPPAFAEAPLALDVPLGGASLRVAADADRDGDIDFVAADNSGNIYFYENLSRSPVPGASASAIIAR